MDHIQSSEMPIESNNASGTHILDLNFDCLREIFSLESFSILDLCSVGETHYRLKDVVDDVLAKRFEKYDVDLREITNRNAARILTNFGPLISELSIYDGRKRKLTKLLDSVIEFCNGTLMSIKLEESTVSDQQLMIKLNSIFGQLRKICLENCTIVAGKTLFCMCESLVDLELYDVNFNDHHSAFENTFTKLRGFTLHCNSGSNFFSDFDKTVDFLSRHQNLKSLNLYRWDGTSHLLPAIVDNCKQLTELAIPFSIDDDQEKFENALSSILMFEHLNLLRIGCAYKNITKFIPKLNDLKSLKFLSLWFVNGDSEFISTLSKLTFLEWLELWKCLELPNLNPLAGLKRLNELKITSAENLDFDVISMIKRLINLKTLYLDVQSFKMDKKMYLQIVDVVRHRPAGLQNALQIKCYTAENASANSFSDADSRKLVKIIKF